MRLLSAVGIETLVGIVPYLGALPTSSRSLIIPAKCLNKLLVCLTIISNSLRMVLLAKIVNHFILCISIFIISNRWQRLHGFPSSHDLLIQSKLLLLAPTLHLLLLFLQITQINLHLTNINLLLLYRLIITALRLLNSFQPHLQLPNPQHLRLLLIIQRLPQQFLLLLLLPVHRQPSLAAATAKPAHLALLLLQQLPLRSDLLLLALDISLHLAETQRPHNEANLRVLQQVFAAGPLALVDVYHALNHLEELI